MSIRILHSFWISVLLCRLLHIRFFVFTNCVLYCVIYSQFLNWACLIYSPLHVSFFWIRILSKYSFLTFESNFVSQNTTRGAGSNFRILVNLTSTMFSFRLLCSISPSRGWKYILWISCWQWTPASVAGSLLFYSSILVKASSLFFGSLSLRGWSFST